MYFCLKFVEKMLSKAVTSDTENQCNSVQGGAHTTQLLSALTYFVNKQKLVWPKDKNDEVPYK